MRLSDGVARLALKATTASSADKWLSLGLLLMSLAQDSKENPLVEAADIAVDRVVRAAAKMVDIYMMSV